jgi:hypothetical protein
MAFVPTTRRRPLWLTFAALWAGAVSAIASAQGGDCPHPLVERDTLSEVMAPISGYDTGATTNQSRFVADVLFGLSAHPALAGAQTFQIQPERFFEAWLADTGTHRTDAPLNMRQVLEYGQRFVVDTRPDYDFDSSEVEAPRRVFAVRVSWPDGPDAPTRYSYHDELAEPEVRMRHDRVITYLIADFGDFIAFEDIDGVSGRPTSGALGALFGLLGTAPIRSTRFAVADDGTQVVRSRVSKLFGYTAEATVDPDGHATRGTADGRHDLHRLARRLAARFRLVPESEPPAPCTLEH